MYGDSRSFKTFLLIYLAVVEALGKDFASTSARTQDRSFTSRLRTPRGLKNVLSDYVWRTASTGRRFLWQS